jgi:hypothetical protein
MERLGAGRDADRPELRVRPMMRSVAAIVAGMVVVIGCGSATAPSASSVIPTPSLASSPESTVSTAPSTSIAAATPMRASPSSSPASTVSTAPSASIEAPTEIPDALAYVWLGPARDITALGGPQALSIIRIKGKSALTALRFDYIFGAQGEEALGSFVSVPAPGQVRFNSADTTGGCRVDDQGTYEWATTADGAGLTMSKVDEQCAPRAEAVVGDWVRAACKEFGCLGNLDAGTHQTAFFEPLGQPDAFGATWRMQYGQLSYAVPSGWANAVDDPNFYNIVPQDEYSKAVSDATRYPGIVLLPDVKVAAQDEACSPKVEPGVGQTFGELAARLARIPSLEVGAATPISIAGRSGTMLDVALKQGWSRFCAVNGGVPVLRQGGDDWRMTVGGRWRLMLLDVAPGRTMGILIDAFDEPSRFDDLVAQAMPIVTSFELRLTTP